ncbi:MAG TPA: zinc ribbon domain-containing protein [Ignavibacteriaceae bacterium]|nr:zinc ribbon domain-containing protein [Ignavibacteriaceae bacterium]
MKESARFISPVLFFLVALCFFLPFVSFTCQEQKIATVTGMELVTGTKIEKFQMQKFNPETDDSELTKQNELNSEPMAIAAFIFAILGIVVSLNLRYSKILSVVSAALGILMLLFLRSSLGKQITGDFDFRIVEISYEWGYYLAIIFFAAVFGLNLYKIIAENKAVPANIDEIAGAGLIKCADCGHMNSEGSIFCSKCGHTLNL